MRSLLIAFCSLFAVACSPSGDPIEITFVPTWKGRLLSCEDDNGGVRMTDLRFYVSSLQLIDGDGEAHAVTLTPDAVWQSADVALLDFENSEGGCLNGTPETNDSVRGLAAVDGFEGLHFTVGVPFDLNHADPLKAAPPLDDSAMHWHWRSGYKFLRAGVETANDGFWIHTGSAGCKGTVQNITGCRFPNRVNVELDGFDPTTGIVHIDVAALLAGTDLEDGEPGDCSSGPAESSCTTPFASLGIDFASGNMRESQSVFYVAAP